MLKFEYTIQSRADDTASSATSYKQIGDMLEHFTKNMGMCVSQISQTL